MKKSLLYFCSLFLCTPSIAEAGAKSVCTGTLITTLDTADGTDVMTAIQSTFTLDMKEDGTATMLLENPYSPPLKGLGKESGNENTPWDLTAKDDGGNVFKGSIMPIKPLMQQDSNMYIMLTLKTSAILINGPMACTFQ